MCAFPNRVVFAFCLLSSLDLHSAEEVMRLEAPPRWIHPYHTDLLADPPAANTPADAHFLLVDRQTHAEEQTRYFHCSYRVLTESGVQENSQLLIPFDPAYETLTLHQLRIIRNGRVINKLRDQEIQILHREQGAERQIYDGNRTASILLEDVRVRDVVEYAYSIQGANPVLAGHFTLVESTRWSAPVHQSRLRVFWSVDRPVKWRNQDSPVPPTLLSNGRFKQALLEEEDLPAVPSDGDLPAGFSAHSWLEFSDFPDWQSVAQWGAALFAEEAELPAEARAVVEQLRRQRSREEQILGALRWVQDNIRYVGLFHGIHSHRPFPLDTVVSRRFGDCKDKSRLLAAMLRALGIECRVGLVSTASRAAIIHWIPAPNAFDHAVVGIQNADGFQWLDATASYQRGPLASLYFPDYGWALPLGSDSPGLIRVQPTGGDISRLETREQFTLKDYRGSASLIVTTAHYGGRADGARAFFATRRRDEIEKTYLNHYARQHPKIRQEKPLRVEDDEAGNVFTTVETYHIDELWTPKAGDPAHLEFKLAASLVEAEFFLPATRLRSMPFFVPHPRQCVQIIEVDFPSPLRLNNDESAIVSPAFVFSVKEASTDRKTTLSYRYQSRASQVEAAASERHFKDSQNALNQVGYTFTIPARYASASLEELNQARASGGEVAVAGQPLVWGLIIAGILGGAVSLALCVLAFFWDPRPRPAPPSAQDHHAGPSGLGGWLVLVTLGAIFRPAYQVYAFFSGTLTLDAATWANVTQPGSAAYHPLWEPFLMADAALSAGMIPLSVLTLVLLFRKRTSFPAFQILSMVLAALYLGGITLCFSRLPGIEPAIMQETVQSFGKACTSAVIWVPYLLVSKRVRNTFTRRRRPSPSSVPPPLPAAMAPGVREPPLQSFPPLD